MFYPVEMLSQSLELSRYAARTFNVSKVLCESVRKPQDGHCKTLTRTIDAVKFLRLFFQHVLPKGVQRFRYGGIWASCSRAMLHAAQAILNIIKTVDSVKGYIEKAFVPEVRRSFECPNCHCLSSHWIFYNTS